MFHRAVATARHCWQRSANLALMWLQFSAAWRGPGPSASGSMTARHCGWQGMLLVRLSKLSLLLVCHGMQQAPGMLGLQSRAHKGRMSGKCKKLSRGHPGDAGKNAAEEVFLYCACLMHFLNFTSSQGQQDNGDRVNCHSLHDFPGEQRSLPVY